MPETPKALRNLTARFIYLLIVATVGPLLFGFHLVRRTHIHPNLVFGNTSNT